MVRSGPIGHHFLRKARALVCAALGITFATGAAARADVILHYTFDPGTTLTSVPTNCYIVSGSFDYDVDTELVTAANYVTTQNCGGPEGPFIFNSTVATPSLTTIEFVGDAFGDGDQLIFESSLAMGGTDYLTGSFNYYVDGIFVGAIPDGGSATASIATVPEPTSFTLLGSALLVFGFLSLGRLNLGPRFPLATPRGAYRSSFTGSPLVSVVRRSALTSSATRRESEAPSKSP